MTHGGGRVRVRSLTLVPRVMAKTVILYLYGCIANAGCGKVTFFWTPKEEGERIQCSFCQQQFEVKKFNSWTTEVKEK
jgi:hypothetical protein